jgi:2,3-dihydroxybiphenyl 1,2-dioxygenase
MGVRQLGYLGVNVSTKNVQPWISLARDVLGCEVRQSGDERAPVLLRLDEQHHRVALRPTSGEEGVAYVGWEVATRQGLDELANRLGKNGIAVRHGTPQEKAERKVVDFYAFSDPEGFPVEIYFGASIDENPPRYARSISGFNCGQLGLGHLIQVSRDPRGTAQFYIDMLGMRLSDYIAWDEADATFLHCNPRHHSLALMNECYGMKRGQLHHFMLEVKSLDDVGRAYDIVREKKLPLILSLGKHSNDHMVSFYMATPSGFGIEYGFGGRLIEDEDAWRVQVYGSPKQWGHALMIQ